MSYQELLLSAARNYSYWDEVPMPVALNLCLAYVHEGNGRYPEYAEVLAGNPVKEKAFYEALTDGDLFEARHIWNLELMDYCIEDVEKEFRSTSTTIKNEIEAGMRDTVLALAGIQPRIQ